ncbi:twin-arginine translocation signal domain-containing protein [Salinirubrum litoreum]|uniref:Twin-arginine translocation signal domain-containing protein n=1 Tax=Salinirubrum litoreum TaxID=1126234 RepID=A0ABD5RBP4_9EURY
MNRRSFLGAVARTTAAGALMTLAGCIARKAEPANSR